MKTLKDTARKLWKDESAQGATEYILLLVVVVALAVMFRKNIITQVEGLMGKLGTDLSSFGQ